MMRAFEKWWKENELRFIDAYGPYDDIARPAWQAATERAVRIVIKYEYKEHGERLAQRIREG